MCKLRKSSALTCVLLSPGIGCYLSETTFLQARMMTIPDPVANTACAEETTLMCGRKETKREGSGEVRAQSSPEDSIKPKLCNLAFPLPAPGGNWSGRRHAPDPQAAGRCG